MKLYGAIITILFSSLVCAHADKQLTIFVHGTHIPGMDYRGGIFGGSIPLGFRCATELTHSYHPHDIISAFCTGEHALSTKSNLYFFGWSGLFPTLREQAAQELYELLIELLSEETISLRIRFITHSHGGNVVMYLAHLIDKEKAPIVIEELVLMGCPIQEMTEPYAHLSCIKKIYNLYSKGDGIQQSDPQGLYPEARQDGARPHLFSRRTFSKKRDNLWEIAIRVNRIKIGHQEFMEYAFLSSIQQIIDAANTYEAGDIHINLITNGEKPIPHINLIPQQ